MPDQADRWSLVIHGGSGQITPQTWPAEAAERARAGLRAALDLGAELLARGAAALDAVQAAVAILEDDPHFNAGRGAVLTHEGMIELDAAIMDGDTRAAGAVAGVTVPRSPVALARAVMVEGRHVMLSGAGADAFAREAGLEPAPPGWFETPERRAHWREFRERGDGFDTDLKYGTVGAVACDRMGGVAAATSTGGLTGKRWGRIGDSALIGSGTWADSRACAVSCTGTGEAFIRAAAGHAIAERMRLLGEPAGDAAETVMADVTALGGTGGVIVAGPGGVTEWRFTTPGMFRARATSLGERMVAMFADEG